MTKMDTLNIRRLPHQTLKERGNRLFAEARYMDAILHYTYAIENQPNISSYYSNRALCYVQLQEYAKALPDCKRSIEMDEQNLKAYFFAGQAHLGLGQWDEALTKLVHAHNLALEQHRNFGDEITSVIRLTKRKRFEALDEKRKREEISLQVYINELILKDAERQRQAVVSVVNGGSSHSKPNQPTASIMDSDLCHPDDEFQQQPPTIVDVQTHSISSSETEVPISRLDSDVLVHAMEVSQSVSSSATSPEGQGRLTQITNTAQKRIAELNDLFGQVDSRRQKREVPDYLCGRISFELMLDPVITPSGITYDRRSIIAHLRKVGHFDPLSRQPLTENQLIPNLIMKEVVHSFLEENPWAESY